MSTARPAVTVWTFISDRYGLAWVFISAIWETKLFGTTARPVATDVPSTAFAAISASWLPRMRQSANALRKCGPSASSYASAGGRVRLNGVRPGYGPESKGPPERPEGRFVFGFLARPEGFEPPTY
jgi:hypothetical protein